MGPRLQQAENQHHCVTLTAYRRQHRQVLLLRPMPQSRRGSLASTGLPLQKERREESWRWDIRLYGLTAHKNVWNGITVKHIITVKYRCEAVITVKIGMSKHSESNPNQNPSESQ